MTAGACIEPPSSSVLGPELTLVPSAADDRSQAHSRQLLQLPRNAAPSSRRTVELGAAQAHWQSQWTLRFSSVTSDKHGTSHSRCQA